MRAIAAVGVKLVLQMTHSSCLKRPTDNFRLAALGGSKSAAAWNTRQFSQSPQRNSKQVGHTRALCKHAPNTLLMASSCFAVYVQCVWRPSSVGSSASASPFCSWLARDGEERVVVKMLGTTSAF